ncbi:MAG: hypothetical protein U5K76_02750 [Woeseiaceae bacterium]|nr:hypothetical protein [Woeseiaceae bacterium]
MNKLRDKWTDGEHQRSRVEITKQKLSSVRTICGAYKAAHKRGILDEVCSHMTELKTDWTYEMLAAEARKYSSRTDFSANSNAYQIAAKRGMLG